MAVMPKRNLSQLALEDIDKAETNRLDAVNQSCFKAKLAYMQDKCNSSSSTRDRQAVYRMANLSTLLCDEVGIEVS